VQSLTLAKDKLNKVKTNLHKIKGSPIKRDITKYQALLEECQQLHIDPFFTPDNSKLNALKDKQEYKKQLIASIANLESKKKVIVNETKKVQNAYSQTIDTLSQQFNELDMY
jgi:Tfp pilus assembly protein PilN